MSIIHFIQYRKHVYQNIQKVSYAFEECHGALHWNFDGSNTDGSFTMAISNLFLSP